MHNEKIINHSAKQITNIFFGKTIDIGDDIQSAIRKQPINNRCNIDYYGLTCDEQSDKTHHGGLDRAISHYPAEHYQYWRQLYPKIIPDILPPLFGENLSTTGFNENEICIGDIFQIGTCLLEVSQPRSPCWKLNHMTGIRHFSKSMQDSQRCGWLYRVVEPGMVDQEDFIKLMDRPYPEYTVKSVIVTFYQQNKHEEMKQMASLKPLAESWKIKAFKRMNTGLIENWNSRLFRFW